MDYRDDEAQAQFRRTLRQWLVENNPGGALSSTDEAYWTHAASWHRALHAAGWFGVSFPERFGGQALSPLYEAIVDDELAMAGAPPKPSLAYIVHGMMRSASEETCARFLPGMVAGEEKWCQGFSEPGAGSDLAALRTTAVLDGDEYVVNGHKIWTSYSDIAHWCLLLARTDPDAPKHKGITAFALPMHQAGVRQLPLKMINGISNEFGELVLTDARIPVENMISAPGGGWAMAMNILNHERSPADLGYTARYARASRTLEAVAVADHGLSPSARRALSLAHVHSEVLRMHVKRRLSERISNPEPGAEGAIDKQLMTTVDQIVGQAAREVGSWRATSQGDNTWLNAYLYSRAATVMGGSAQIQRNVIAAQLLGL